jgi:hypothetical protein
MWPGGGALAQIMSRRKRPSRRLNAPLIPLGQIPILARTSLTVGGAFSIRTRARIGPIMEPVDQWANAKAIAELGIEVPATSPIMHAYITTYGAPSANACPWRHATINLAPVCLPSLPFCRPTVVRTVAVHGDGRPTVPLSRVRLFIVPRWQPSQQLAISPIAEPGQPVSAQA